MYDRVGGVGLPGIPAKVFKPVVGRVAIGKMATLHAIWAWANECFQNQAVNLPCLPATGAVTKPYFQVSVLAGANPNTSPLIADYTVTTPPTWVNQLEAGPDTSVIADAVTREADNGPVLDCIIDIRHDRPLTQVGGVQGGGC